MGITAMTWAKLVTVRDGSLLVLNLIIDGYSFVNKFVKKTQIVIISMVLILVKICIQSVFSYGLVFTLLASGKKLL